MTKSIDLKKKLEDIRVQSLGWLMTAITVFKATIVSTLLYGCGAWVNMTKAQCELVEAIQRQCLTTVLGITSRCHYQSLLNTTNIPLAMDIVRKTKVTFLNDLIHVKEKGIALRVIKQEHALTPNKGIISEVKLICSEWGLTDVTQEYAEPRKLKVRIESVLRRNILIGSLCGKSAPHHYIRDKSNQIKCYFTMPKEKALLGLSYDVGCLNMRGNRRNESNKKYGTVQCWVPGCTGKDTLEHVMSECQSYNTKRGKDEGVPEDWIEFLYTLNKERFQRFKTSLVNWKS